MMKRRDTSLPPRPWALGIAAAKANFVPGLLLWSAGVAIIVAWFTWPAAQHVLSEVGELKTQYGYVYSMISTALFAGALPFFMRRLARSEGERHDLPMLVFLVLFWAYKGLEVDALYRLQSYMLGDNHTVRTLVLKVCVDQFVYCPLIAMPLSILPLAWAQAGFRKSVWLQPFRPPGFRHWYAWTVLPIMISNWSVWMPAVAMIYAMPLELQLPIQNLVACMWVMMMLFMTKPNAPQPATSPKVSNIAG